MRNGVLFTALAGLLFLYHPAFAQAAACTPNNPPGTACLGQTCNSLGQTTMDGDQQNIVACLKSDTGALVWKSMSSSSSNVSCPSGQVLTSIINGQPTCLMRCGTGYLSDLWGAFLQGNYIWGAGQGEYGSGVFHNSFSIAQAGTYILKYSVDNDGSVTIDGNTVINLVADGYANFTGDHPTSISLSAGTHTIDISYRDTGGEYGVAAAIYDGSGNEIYNLKNSCI